VVGSLSRVVVDVSIFVLASLLSTSATWAVPQVYLFELEWFPFFGAQFILQAFFCSDPVAMLCNVASVVLLTRVTRESWRLSAGVACIAHFIAFFLRPNNITLQTIVAGICCAEIKLHLLYHSPFQRLHIRYLLVWCAAVLPLYQLRDSIFSYSIALLLLCRQTYNGSINWLVFFSMMLASIIFSASRHYSKEDVARLFSMPAEPEQDYAA